MSKVFGDLSDPVDRKRYISVTYDRKDYCLPQFLEENLRDAVERAARQMYKDLEAQCLKVSVKYRNKIKIWEDYGEDGIKLALIVPEGAVSE